MVRYGLVLAFLVAVPVHAEPIGPIVAGYQAIADEERDDRAGGWPDLTPAAVDKRTAKLVAIEKRLEAPAPAGEGEQDRLTREILEWRVKGRIAEAKFDTARIPFIGGDGFYTTPIYTASTTVLHNEAEAKAWTAKIAALPVYYGQAIANMKRGLATNFVQPKIVTEATLKQLRTAAAQPVADNALLKPFTARPASVSEARWAELKADATKTVADKVKPAEAEAVRFMAAEYLPHARDTLGISSAANGADYYAHLVRVSTTTDMTPDQVFALGQSEVTRISAEMEAAKREVGFKGDMHAFLTMLRTDPRFYASDPDDYYEKVAAVTKRVDEQLPRYFGLLPRLPFTIKFKGPELEGTSGGYFLGDPQKGVAGAVMFSRSNTHDPLFSMPAWILHEGVPGHHTQIALAQERTDLPKFRRSDDMTAYVEGWALYTERLGEEMGIYRTPYERIGRLSFEVWRACRLVMDVGIHMKGWSFDQAASCLRDHTALPESVVTGETLRYVGWPAQALAYKIGEIRIRAMRARAEATLGPKFDLRAFHDMLLDDGPMPMAILDAQVDAWIAKRSAAQ